MSDYQALSDLQDLAAAGLPPDYQEVEAIYDRTLGRGMRSLAVCAANPGEGVSTLAEALARRAHAVGRRPLLVELNLYRPRLSQRMGAPRSPWLPGQEAAATSCALDGLAILPAPLAPQTALLLRERDQLRRCLDSWLETHDLVIFDTAPLNAGNRGNIPAELVCAACDGCVLVVMAGCTEQSGLKQATARLSAAGAQLVGSVFNDLHNPSLASEMIRETSRLERQLPRLSAWLRGRIRTSVLLNAPV